jgi:phage/plasmid-like protein (TIGR03299 family)
MPANVETMFSGSRTTPWHGLGKVVEDALSSHDALIQSGLDWEVVPCAMQFTWQDDPLSYPCPEFSLNVRSTDKKVMGVTTPKYRIVQNREAFDFTNVLLNEGIKYETAGSLTNGTVWLLARMPETEVVGESHGHYLVFVNSFDGKGAIRVFITDVRVVCQNTLNMAIRGAKRSWSCRHMGDITEKMKEARRTLELASKYQMVFAEEANRLAETKFTVGQFECFVNQIIPEPEDKENLTERVMKRITAQRNDLSSLYYNTPDLTSIRGTKWGVLQATSDYFSHRTPLKATKTYKENFFGGFLNGDKDLDRAYDLLKVEA